MEIVTMILDDLEQMKDTLYSDFDNFWSYEVEVIGNIHDNKELLEEGGE